MKWNEVILVAVKTTSHETKKEIIEVGLCKFDTLSCKKSDSISLFVQPIKTKINDYCTKVTGITEDDVRHAITFFELCEFMRKYYGTEDKPWASYGNLAETVFKRQCEENFVLNPLSDRFINLRHLFALFCSKDSEINLRDALLKYNIDVPGNSAEDDVLNIGILFTKMLRDAPLFKV